SPGPPPPPGEEPPGAPQPSPGGHGSLWLGIGIGVAAFLLVWALSLLVGGTDMYWIPIMAWLGMPPLLLIAGIILAVIPRTRRTGAGILIAVGAGVLIVGGVCVALLTTY
ncbi:hypothetical protein, partial [Microbacterium terrae]|uniref:hypothetical protein n=1 Tax=Microbacterium terrae TaxID=69369 RepID=UPI0005EC5D85